MMRPCPVDGCHGRRGRLRIMCATCWQSLPYDTRQDVHRQLRAGAGSAEHYVAMDTAIKQAGDRIASKGTELAV